jgi:decaprenyl-phosphate phosphoribosyltransferase
LPGIGEGCYDLEHRSTARGALIRPFLRSIRPAQWAKNLFVVAPLLFARRLDDRDSILRSGAAFVAFCLLAGGVYLLNDLADKERDRQHPTKKLRPIASGALSEGAARLGLSILWIGAALLALPLGVGFILAAFGYLALNFLYSTKLRATPFLDVAAIALGFLLRVVAGGEAISVPLSPWIILNTFLLAFFMGLGKRLQELSTHGLSSGRSSLKGYTTKSLRLMLYLTGGATAGAYALYATAARLSFGTDFTLLTIPFPALGILRFVQLCGRPGLSPTEAILKDPLFLGVVGIWSALVILIVS